MEAMLGRVPDAAAGFSSAAVFPVLREACERVGLSGEGAELLRLGQNALFRLADAPVVVRIARSADRLPRMERPEWATRTCTGSALDEGT